MNKLIDTISPELTFSISESAEVDGKHILAKVKGEFFVPNGKSRNGRFYPKELWEKVISSPDVKEKLSKRLMFGTIGHDAELGDKGLREGLTSHVMTSITIDESGRGIGEALILNTPTGQILNTVLRAGSKPYVSSRANGTFGREIQGVPSVDPDTYKLDGWDFVLEPGFLQANPSIAESLNNLQKNKNSETIFNTDNSNGEYIMENGKSLDATLVQHIVEENVELKKEVGQVTDELNSVKADKEEIEKENAHLKSELDGVQEKLKKLAKYEELGEPEAIEKEKEEMEEEGEELEKFKELGDSPEEVKEALEIAKKHLTTIKEEFGTVPEIKKALSEALSFRKEVDSIGTVSEIKEALASFKKLVEEEEIEKEKEAEMEKEKEVKEISDELEIEPEEVKEMLKKNTASEIREMYKKIAENFSKKSNIDRYTKKSSTVIVEGKKDNSSNLDEGRYSASRLNRINEAFKK